MTFVVFIAIILLDKLKRCVGKMLEYIKKYLTILLGVSMVAFAVAVFYTPNKIVGGGVLGISTILYHTLHIDQGIPFFVINGILILISFKALGKEFTINSVVVGSLLSALVSAFSHIPPLTRNVFLATVFGAVLYGLGISLTLINHASTGGTDIIARLVQHSRPYFKIGNLLLCVDFCIIFSSLIVFRNVELSLFGILALFISSVVIDYFIKKLNTSKLVFVVTNKGEEISKYLVDNSPRGVTIIDSKGAYTMHENSVIICALKEKESTAFLRRILRIDKDAFIIFADSSKIVGNGFKVYD